jgi:uncharacterized protein involved in exopolysaccharide biosynthesis
MIRHDGRGEGAIGDAGPVPDAKVKKNAAPAYVAPKGNGADRPIGLVDLDARVASLEAKVETLVARIETLERHAAVTPVSSPAANRVPVSNVADQPVSSDAPDRKQYMRDLMRDRRAAAKVGLTLAEYRQQQAIAASPANVRLLVPVSAEVAPPAVGAPSLGRAPS